MQKEWYWSKTLWINIISVAAIIIQSYTGYLIDPAMQVSALAIINIIVRAITGNDVTFGSKTLKEHLS